jgi:hypothetical protein
MLDAGACDRGDEERVPEEELVVEGVCRLVLRVFEEERAEDGRAVPVALLEERIKVRKEAHAELDHGPAHRLVRLPESPRFL